jgi:hypothetical protein
MTTTWSDGIRAVHAESSGVMRMFLVGPAEQHAIFAAALEGGQLAWCLMRLMKESTSQVEDASRRKPALCLWFFAVWHG